VSESPTLIYLEADDEITAVVRRVRAAEPGRVVIVAPGRSRATSSAVALRLLARAGEEDGRDLAVVGDALTRSLAAEAGLTTHASVEDARAAIPAAPGDPTEIRHAAIHVVRGPVSEETAPVAVTRLTDDTETRPVGVVRPRGPVAARRRRRVAPLVAVLAAAGAILVAGAVAAAMVLPAATIRLVPQSSIIGPVAYRIPVNDPERIEGTVTETAVVTATGTYAIQAAATGTVIFFNWNFVPVEVPAGTLVAAGEQAFATVATITVPRGALTAEGTIRAGEEAVGVGAAAVGTLGNVPAEAINQVLSEQTAARLRGFPDNTRQLVVNPEATAGGIDTTGAEITQADLDAAATALRETLATRVSEELEGTDDGLFADPVEPPEPVITVPEGLVGTRDQPQAEITGELVYERLLVDEEDVEADARERFAADDGALPDGHALLDDATQVTLGGLERDGDRLEVAVSVRGRSARVPDRSEVLARAIGLSADEAVVALADLGKATVDLWPGWVATVPDSDWRIDVDISGIDEGDPVPSSS
jgi:hypothetical protein